MHGTKILIADDKPLILGSLKKALSNQEYQVTGAGNGKEVITCLRDGQYDLVITDLMMPEINGTELIQEIKKTAPETSVIIFTGYGDMHSVIDALRAGVDDYLLKPCEIDELLLRVSNCLEKRSLVHRLKEQNRRLKKEILARKRLEEKLRGQAEKVKLFSYSIAHDIKAPAISLHGLTHLVDKKFKPLLPQKGQDYCNQILHSSLQIITLVDQINSYMAAKESQLRLEWVPMQKVVGSVRKEFELQLDGRQIHWVEPSDLPTIRADGTALVRALRNCIDNALKYGGEELHEIIINYKQTPKFHIFSVSNDGVGMTRDECDTIFELFTREKSSGGVQGTGLGLAIVKELIQQHKGEVWADPGEEKGVSFYMSIARDL